MVEDVWYVVDAGRCMIVDVYWMIEDEVYTMDDE